MSLCESSSILSHTHSYNQTPGTVIPTKHSTDASLILLTNINEVPLIKQPDDPKHIGRGGHSDSLPSMCCQWMNKLVGKHPSLHVLIKMCKSCVLFVAYSSKYSSATPVYPFECWTTSLILLHTRPHPEGYLKIHHSNTSVPFQTPYCLCMRQSIHYPWNTTGQHQLDTGATPVC